MKCQILFSGKNDKNIVSLSSAEFAHGMVFCFSGIKQAVYDPLKWQQRKWIYVNESILDLISAHSRFVHIKSSTYFDLYYFQGK